MSIMNVVEWRPDLPDLAEATTLAQNVVPRTSQSYGPFRDLAPWSSSALDGVCLGAATAQDVNLSVSVFAGTETKLYRMTSTTWDDVSGTAYGTLAGDTWNWELYGRYVFATNFADPIQYFLQGTSTLFADLSADAPNARYMCTPKNFLMVANTDDPVGGANPARLWWSAAGDPTNWPTPGSATAQQLQSDYNDFLGDYGEITGIVDSLSSSDVAIFFRHAIWRGVYTGPPDIFDFFPAENGRGCPCPNSIVAVGGVVYFMAEDGFYAFDGSQSTPLGVDKFDQWFWANVNEAWLQYVIGAADVTNKMYLLAFPSTLSSDGTPDTILMYRWDIRRASVAKVSLEWLAQFLSFGATLDSLSALGFTDLDTIPYSLDSRVWVGGAFQLGAITTSHELAYFSGDNLAAQVGLQTLQITPGRKTWLGSARPLVQKSGGTPTIQIGARDNLYDTPVYGPAVPPNAMGECPQRSDARYHDAILGMPAGSIWSHISGADITEEYPSGER